MFSKESKIFTSAILTLLVACSPALYLPTAEIAENTGITITELQKGRDMYVNHCGSCHNLYLPHRFPKNHWITEMHEMQKKAKISNEDADDILKYILSGTKQK